METKKETKDVTKKGKIYPCLTEIVKGTSVFIDNLYVQLNSFFSPYEMRTIITALIFPSYSLKDVIKDDAYECLKDSPMYHKSIPITEALSLVGNTLIDVFPTTSIDVSCDGFYEVVNFKK